MESKEQVFISYAREDWGLAKRLYDDLKHAGGKPWLDTEDLLPGQNWKVIIPQVLKESSFVLVLLSSHSVSKRGFVQKELKEALDLLDQFPPSKIFIIPVRLDDCEPVDERLRSIHRADLFRSYENGLNQIKRVIGIEKTGEEKLVDRDKKGDEQHEVKPLRFHKRPIIILAAHDDGSGAHVTMSYICRGILRATKNVKYKPLIVYLHGGNYATEWAVKLWENTSENMQWLRYERLDKLPDDEDLEDKAGIWLKTKNMIQFELTEDGRLDPAKTHERLIKNGSDFNLWGFQIGFIPKERVVLTIEIGVPQLNKWAERLQHKPPAITVGDQVWSCALRKTLELSGEYDKETTAAIFRLSEYERCATEVWFFPLLAPSEYIDNYSIASIPISVLPGFFGPKQAKQGQDIEKVLVQISKIWGDGISNALRNKNKRLIVMSLGSSGVWKVINNKMTMSFIDHSEDVLLFSQCKKDLNRDLLKLLPESKDETEDIKLWMVADGGIREIPQRMSLLPYYALADFGVTRGGIVSLEFVNAQTPFLIVQEPNHWLSLKQQAALKEAGLAYSCSFLSFQSNAIDLIQGYLGDAYKEHNERMKARMNFMDFEIEDKWVSYILKYHTKIFN